MPRDSVAAIERQQGIIETLQAAGVEPAGAVGCLDWQPEQGYDATRSLLARGIRPAALICFNDRLALGAYNALAEGGLTIPTDTSVVSFDDDLIASWVTPRLTSIALPHYDLGRAAVEALLKPRAPASEEAPVYRIPMPLQERESVAPPGTERATAGKRRAKSTVRVAPGSSAGRVRR
jgi:LacI family transcriptional regulator